MTDRWDHRPKGDCQSAYRLKSAIASKLAPILNGDTTYMRKFRCVVIGCGRMGQVHSRRLAADPRAVLAGFFDADQRSAIKLRDRTAPDAPVFESVENAVAQPDADAAIICTPVCAHASQVRAAASHNLHVLCEKPLGSTRSEILQLIDLTRERRDLNFMLGYQRRFWAVYRRLKDEIESGQWGRIVSVVSVNAERWQQTIGGTWRDDASVNSGGFLEDAGSHRLDVLFYVTALRPDTVSASSSRSGSHVEIITMVNGALSGDSQDRVPFSLSFVGNSHSFHEALFIHCEKADLIVRDLELFTGRNNQLERIELPSECSGRDSVQNPVTGFLDLLSGDVDNTSPFACALPVFDTTTAILDAAYRPE